jgi:uncharacterized protein (TIGR00251 family)
MTIEVKVQPRAKRNALTLLQDGRWKVTLTAPAVEGKANEALIEFFARGLRIPRSRIRLVTGAKSRLKTLVIDGIPERQFHSWAAHSSDTK